MPISGAYRTPGVLSGNTCRVQVVRASIASRHFEGCHVTCPSLAWPPGSAVQARTRIALGMACIRARRSRCEVTAGLADVLAARADLAARSCYGHPKQLIANVQGSLLLRTRSRYSRRRARRKRRRGGTQLLRTSEAATRKCEEPKVDCHLPRNSSGVAKPSHSLGRWRAHASWRARASWQRRSSQRSGFLGRSARELGALTQGADELEETGDLSRPAAYAPSRTSGLRMGA